jgi:hypothetical protein
MAEKLTTAMGPSQQEPSNWLGIASGIASGLTPESSIAQGKLLESQDKAAMDLYKLQGKQKQEPRLRMPAKEFSDLSDQLSNVMINRKATETLREFAFAQNRRPMVKKLGLLGNLYKKALFWVKGGSENMTPEEAKAMRYYWSYVNSEIKRITGAQMSEPEARRLMKQMPKLYQNPKAFMETWDDIMQETEKRLLNKVGGYRLGNWHGVEGLLPLYEEIKATPYQRTVFPEKKIQTGGKKKTGFSSKQEAGIKRVMRDNNVSRAEAIRGLKNAGVL